MTGGIGDIKAVQSRACVALGVMTKGKRLAASQLEQCEPCPTATHNGSPYDSEPSTVRTRPAMKGEPTSTCAAAFDFVTNRPQRLQRAKLNALSEISVEPHVAQPVHQAL